MQGGTYIEANAEHWQKDYEAENVESFVFRWQGRILNQTLGITSGRVLDWGCGSGAALQFFQRKGFDVYGVDISEPNIARAGRRIGKDRVRIIDPVPNDKPFFTGQFDVVISIQALYFLTPTALNTLLVSLTKQMPRGAIIYATMIGSRCYFFDKGKAAEEGMRHVSFVSDRIGTIDQYINFMESKEQVLSTFAMFDPITVGYYDADYGDGSEFHYTFTGRRK